MPAVKVVAVYRPYWSCVRSLHRRHGYQLSIGQPPAEVHMRFFEEPDLALRMWINHNRALVRERETLPDTTMIVSFENVAQGFPLVQRLTSRWDMPFDQSRRQRFFDPTATEAGDEIKIFDPDLAAEADQLLSRLEELHAD